VGGEVGWEGEREGGAGGKGRSSQATGIGQCTLYLRGGLIMEVHVLTKSTFEKAKLVPQLSQCVVFSSTV
jgi:hypothetical protein